MKHIYILAVAATALSACGGGNQTAPRNLDNACALLDERPSFAPALAASERKWGIPTAVMMAAIYQESKFDGDARTPHQYALGVIPMGRQSSAYGFSQALDGTWDEYLEATGKHRAKRDDIDDASDFMGWYMSQAVERLGIEAIDAENLYLAYHEGYSGYARGSYRSKDWLVDVADEVGTRAVTYSIQLASCS